MTLKELEIGKSASITKVGGSGALRQHFLDMGVIPGVEVTVLKYAPMGDPVEILIHGYNLTLRLDDAAKIDIEPVTGKSAGAGKDAKPAADTVETADTGRNDNKKPARRRKKTPHPGLGEGGKFHPKGTGNPLPRGTVLTFALVGNQNSGKTTLFNQLTGARQHVGNFPGVTVDRKDGVIIGHDDTLITDLPGIYSMSPYSSEELVSRNFVLNEKPKAIINIVDATNIERNLYLTMQLLEMDVPVVVALNMMDEVNENGGVIDVNALEAFLGTPVVPISAAKNQGIEELVEHAVHIALYQEKPTRQDFCDQNDHGGAVHRCLHAVMHLIEDHAASAGIPLRFAASKVIEGDELVLEKLALDQNEKELLEHLTLQLEKERGLDKNAAIAEMRYEVCFLTFNVIGAFFQGLLEIGIGALTDLVDRALTAANVSAILHGLIINGIFEGVGSVLSFLPIIITMFFFLSMLEDSGYIARVAFVMDKLLRRIGLSGRSIVPMLIGFGCTVPAVMASRTLPSERDRKMTILLTPFMSCTAKLPIYGFFVNAFFPRYKALITVALYVLGIIVGILAALVFKKTAFKGEAVPFVMELPNYRLPSPRNVAQLLWEKSKDFLQRAFSVILLATIIVWFLQSFDFRLYIVENSHDSILATIAGVIAPLFAPLGLGDWRIVTSLISGFMAKESVVSVLEILYGTQGGVKAVMTPLAAATLLVFSLLYTPCVAAIAAIRRELGSRWGFYVVVWQCVIAWVAALLVRLIGLMIGLG